MRSSYMWRGLGSALAVLACCGGGCGPKVEPPAGYVPVKDAGDKSFMAVSARGNTIAVSTRRNEGGKYGDLTYWVDAFKHEKVALGRYRLVKEGEIETTGGWKGRLLELHLGQGAAEYTWLVGLFVDPQRICTVEAGGPTKPLEEDMDRLVGAIKTLR